MKKWMCLAACILATGSVAQAFYGWGIYGSYWKPSDADGAFAPGVKISIEMVPSVQLELRGSYFNNMSTEGGHSLELRTIPLEAGLVLDVPLKDVHHLYGGGGFSYFLNDAKDGPSLDDEVGGYITAGYQFNVTANAGLFVEGKYTFVKFDQGVDMGGPGVNAGLMITW